MRDPGHSNGAPISVVIPAYNESATVVDCLSRVLALEFVGQVIVVDDGSTDDTVNLAKAVTDSRILLLKHDKNSGKGAALRTGFRHARLPIVAVQDADLEYDPRDLERLIGPILDGKADVVYGSRFLSGDAHRVLYFWHSVGNKVLTLLSNATTNINLTDMETCYKVFKREVLDSIQIEEDRFGFEPEITAKVAAGNWRIYEVGISYQGRTYEEGKKIGWRDGVHALRCIALYAPPFQRAKRRPMTNKATFGSQVDTTRP